MTPLSLYLLVPLVSACPPQGALREDAWSNLDFSPRRCALESPRQVLEQHVPLTGFVPQKPKLLPSKTNTIPYVGYVTQISARPPQCWVHADGAHPGQTSLSVRENQRLLLDGGLLHRHWNVWKNMEN